MTGKFITFEGSEGSGKSTQAAMLAEHLKQRNLPVLLLREPGGVKISESIRALLLDVGNAKMGDECETLLYMAARAQLVKEVLIPALEAGKIVLCDRFLDSTVAYQGYGNGVDVKTILNIGQYATRGVQPDLTVLFDIDARKGLARTGTSKDRIELRSIDYHEKVRQGYLALAKQHPQRIKIIDAGGSKEDISEQVNTWVDQIL